jgi:predicted nucleic acid-binding Zn ribbon protein
MPIYTYRCPYGHEWDEVRTMEGSETSEEPCKHQATGPNHCGVFIPCNERGKKVPSRMNPQFKGSGWTPKFYPNRTGK